MKSSIRQEVPKMKHSMMPLPEGGDFLVLSDFVFSFTTKTAYPTAFATLTICFCAFQPISRWTNLVPEYSSVQIAPTNANRQDLYIFTSGLDHLSEDMEISINTIGTCGLWSSRMIWVPIWSLKLIDAQCHRTAINGLIPQTRKSCLATMYSASMDIQNRWR